MEERIENKWKHLAEDERTRIYLLLSEGLRCYKIGEIIGKDPTTIAKEVNAHRYKKESNYKPRHRCIKASKCTRKALCPDCNSNYKSRCENLELSLVNKLSDFQAN